MLAEAEAGSARTSGAMFSRSPPGIALHFWETLGWHLRLMRLDTMRLADCDAPCNANLVFEKTGELRYITGDFWPARQWLRLHAPVAPVGWRGTLVVLHAKESPSKERNEG